MRKPAFFTWGKKSGAVESEAAAQTLVCESSEAVRAKENTPIPPLLPVHKDTPGGEAHVTYESVNGKPLTHYSQIFINPASLPVITGGAKPDNNEYLAVKHELLTKAYHSLRGYPDFVRSLKGMHGRPDLGRAMEVIVKRFLTRFWDIPASKEHHHCYPWGLALHCLDVGCAEAEKATSWIPMSENGIDEINHAKYLGMVVLLNFVKGLFHDAHKLYQYDMVGYKDNYVVRFDPLRNQGNVLDFKLVYPQRTERWGEPFTSPGKLNAVEFFGLFPRELAKYTPGWQYIEVIVGLFDMEGSDADMESAKRDLSKIGLATMEQMIRDKVETYFMSDKGDIEEEKKPGNNVFMVNAEWAAVHSASFLMAIRPMEGRLYTKDAVKNCLQREKTLSGTASDYELSLLYRVKRPNGHEEVSKTAGKIAFIKMPYLEQVCPGLSARLGRIYFDEKDREAVLALCPGADNFLADLKRKVADQPTAAEAAAAAAKQPKNAAKNSSAHDARSLEEKQVADSPAPGAAPQSPDILTQASEEETSSGESTPSHTETEQQAAPDVPAADDALATDTAARPEEHSAADTAPEPGANCLGAPGEVQTDVAVRAIPETPAKPRMPVQKMVKWTSPLQHLIKAYKPEDSHPTTGWFYVGDYDVYVRTPRFYEKMTNEHLLLQKDWRVIAENICRDLVGVGLLIPDPISRPISFVIPGGGDGSTDGNFLKLDLGESAHRELLHRILVSAPLE